jgi:polysaccharide pyruvyl transferase WcaK-like protein
MTEVLQLSANDAAGLPDSQPLSRADKVLFVCDNRDELNWGCRATSIALHDLIERRYKVSGRVGRRDVLHKESRIAAISRFSGHRLNPLLRAAANAVVQRSDYISGDIERSARQVLANKHHSSFFKGLVEKFEDADRIVVNGEGSMVFKSQERRDVRFQLTMLEVARMLGKPAYYVNAMISDFPDEPRNQETWEKCRKYLSRCAGVQVRDRQSFALLNQMRLDTETMVAPDALFSAADSGRFPRPHPRKIPGRMLASFPEEPGNLAWSFEEPYICVGGSSYFRSRGRFAEGKSFYSALAELIAYLGYRCVFVQTCTGDAFLEPIAQASGCDFIPVHTGIFAGGAILAHAHAFISGRYHPSILASVGGTPCVFLESNSHKMASLRHWLGDVPEEIQYRDEHALTMIRRELLRIAEHGTELRRQIRRTARELSACAKEIPAMLADAGTATDTQAAA